MYRNMLIATLLALSSTALAANGFKSHRRYTVLPTSAQGLSMATACIASGNCIATSINTARRSCDGSEILLKWSTTKVPSGRPVELQGMPGPYNRTWTHTTVLAMLAGPEWTCGV